MWTEQREKLNDNCIGGNESAVNDPDQNSHEKLKHTWQWQAEKNSSGSDCRHLLECDCDDLNLAKALPCSINVNSSLRAVAQISGIDANPYEYEIIDIQASPDTGHIMHPPDPCLKHDKPSQTSR